MSECLGTRAYAAIHTSNAVAKSMDYHKQPCVTLGYFRVERVYTHFIKPNVNSPYIFLPFLEKFSEYSIPSAQMCNHAAHKKNVLQQ
jgi:hypothetical protein